MFLLRKIICLVGMALFVMTMAACAGTQAGGKQITAGQPLEEAFRTELKKELSSLNITIEASENELRDTLNRLTPRELYRGSTRMTGVTALILRDGPVLVHAADNFIVLTVPVSLTLRYGIFETRPLATKLKFKLTASVTPDWRVISEVYYTGLTDLLADEVGIGPVSLKPRSIVEGATQPLQRTLSDLIGRKLNEKFPLRPEVAKVWNAAQKPILLDKKYNAWLMLTPKEALIYPVYAQNRNIRLGVGLKTFAELVVGPEPAIRQPAALPNLKPVSGADRSFRVALHTDLFYSDVLKIVSPLLLGKEFGSDGKRVVLKGLDLYGNGDRLVVKLETAGSLEGTLYLTCRPVFNPQTNIFSVEDVDFDLQTQSMLLKTAEWFLHGTIRSAIQERLNMDLSQRLQQVREMAGKALSRVYLAENLYLVGNVKSVRLNDVLVQKDKLSIQIYTEGESGIVLR